MRLGTSTLMGGAAIGLFLANVGRIPNLALGGRLGAFTLLDLMLVPLWLLLIATLAARRRRWTLDGVSIAGLCFVMIALVTTALAGPRWGLSLGAWAGAGAFLVRWVLYAGFFLLIVTDPDPDEAGRSAWLRLDKAMLAVAGFGVFQSLFLPNFAQRLEPFTGLTFDQQGRRLASTLLDPNFAGSLIAIALLMRLAREAEGLRPHRGGILLLAVALVLTLSRSAVLGVIAGVGVILLVRGLSRPLLRLFAISAAVALPLLPLAIGFAQQFNKLAVDGSALQRLVPWLRGFILVRDYPVMGVGFNAALHAQRAYGWDPVGGSDVSMDGGLIFVAVMTGLLGLFAYLAMIGSFGAAARRTWRTPGVPAERRAFAIGGWAVTIAMIVQALFTNALMIPYVMLPLWVIWGRVMATAPAAAPRTARARSGAPRRAAVLGATAVLALLLTGCEPCAGVANCTTGPQRVVAGTILDRESKQPRAGVEVEAAGIKTRTNAAGRWRLVMPSVNDSVLVVRVTADGSSYEVAGVRVRATTTSGDGEELGTWYDRPVLNYVIGLQYRGEGLNSAQVRFTADAAFGGAVYDVRADGGGYAHWIADAPAAGRITGTLSVTHPSTGTRVYPGFALSGDHVVEPPRVRGVFAVDKTYAFGGNIIFRGTGATTPGATFRFTRTGGLQMTPNSVSVQAGANGFFIFSIEPHGLGTVIGTVTITPPGGGVPSTFPNRTFASYEGNTIPYIGLWPHGERFNWVVEVRNSADESPVAWQPFRFTRTGGLALVNGNVVNGSTNGSGRLLLNLAVPDTGTVTGTLEIRPVGQPAQPAGTLSLRTFAADSQRFAGIRYVTSPP